MRRFRQSGVVAVALAAAFGAGCGGGGDAGDDRRASDAADRAERTPATVEFVTFPSITRLTPNVDVEDPEAGAAIELEAARGELEGGQVVAWASKGEPRVVLEATDLRAAPGTWGGDVVVDGPVIPATRVRPYIEHAMQVERGSPAGRAGTYVDPLIPAGGRDVVLATEERLLAWIDVSVPVDAKIGSYAGSVLIRRANRDGEVIDGDEGILATVPVRLKVRAAIIPKVPALASHVGFDQSQLVRFEGVEAGSRELRDVTDSYAALLAESRLSIGDVGALPPGALRGHRGLAGDDVYLQGVFGRRGVASVRIPFYLTYPFKDPIGRDRAAAVAYLRASAAWARRQGWADRMYVFAFDEPSDADAGAVRELDELLREADPGLRQLVTREASARAFQGIGVDVWGPNINPTRFRVADVAREHRRGRDTWWYPSITTYQPHPTLFIDELRPTPRALGWLAWRYDVDGFLYWTATHWHEVDDPYRDPATYNETDIDGNGDGVLLYPGAPIGLPGTPVPSVRLLQLRDGIEDHDLLTLAQCAGTPAARAAIARAARDVAPAIDQVDPTSDQVKRLRTAVFAAIDRRPRAQGCGAPGP